MNKWLDTIYDSLDLGFSDYIPQMNVRDITIKMKGEIIEHAASLKELDEAVHFSLFNAIGPNHPSVEIYVLDFPSHLRASLYLLLVGYYRQALLCLRSWLEMTLTGVFFGVVETDRTKHTAWKRGGYEAPVGRRLIKKLFARAEFQKADRSYGLRRQVSALYSQLSEFTHGAGVSKYNLQTFTENVPRYNPQSVLLFDRVIRRTFAEVVFCLHVAYGDAVLSSLKQPEVRGLLARLPRRYAKVLECAVAKTGG